jgi:hypothetical protein
MSIACRRERRGPSGTSCISVPVWGFLRLRVWRDPLRLAIAAAAPVVVAPALADKPKSVLSHAEPVAIIAIPIDFDRDNPEHKEFGKLVWRGGVNLFGKSSYFGGYSALAIDASGNSLFAMHPPHCREGFEAG